MNENSMSIEVESLKFDVDNLCMAGKALCRLLEEQSVRLNRPVPAEVSQMRVAISCGGK